VQGGSLGLMYRGISIALIGFRICTRIPRHPQPSSLHSRPVPLFETTPHQRRFLLASRSHLGKSTRCQVECLLAAEHGADRPLVSSSPFASAILIVHCCLVTVESASSKMFEDDDTTSIATPIAFRFSFLCRSRLLLHSLRSKHQCFEVLGISDDRSWYRKDCGCVGSSPLD
jgi:hypothetical protein